MQPELPQPPDGRPSWPIVVIGAGAAGMLAAIFASRAGADVLVLEHASKPGAKIRVSGGGRCNVLPAAAEPGDFHTEGSLHVVRNVLRTWPLEQVTAFFADQLGVQLKREDTGKIFPVSDDAREVVSALLEETRRSGAVLVPGVTVTGISSQPRPEVEVQGLGGRQGRFHVRSATGGVPAEAVIVATGGLSLPKTGSDGAGYRFAEAAGHDLLDRYPALVPLLTTPAQRGTIAGLSVPATITARQGPGGKVRWVRSGDLLFTHKGLSGPVVLDASHQLTGPDRGQAQLEVRFGHRTAEEWETALQAGGSTTVSRAIAEVLPRRLAEHLLDLAGLPTATSLAELRRDDRRRLIATIVSLELDVTGHGGYRLAEVTGGGVPLNEVNPATLESIHTPHLFFAGEVIDVTGRLGGYNFLWAWVSGRLAGRSAAARLHGGLGQEG